MIIQKNTNVQVQEIDKELVCFVPDNDSIICLDEYATIIWGILDETKKFDDIVKVYYDLFECKPDYTTVRHDIDDILSEFVRAGLIITSGDGENNVK